MPQVQMPLFPVGSHEINEFLAFSTSENEITYFNGHLPVFTHAKEDLKSFRLITSQFIINGSAKQRDIAEAFGVPRRTIKRYVKLYRDKGPSGFFSPRKTRSASVLIPEVIERVQQLLDEGYSVSEISKKLTIKHDTLNRAIYSGRLHKKKALHHP